MPGSQRRHLGYKNGKVTLRDVATKAGVSTGTVSRVMNNSANVDEKMRTQVLEVATSLGYIPRTSASNGYIAMYLREIEPLPDHNSYFSRIVYGAQSECRRRGWHFVFGTIGEGPEASIELSRAIQSTHLDGIILENLLYRNMIETALSAGVAVVVVDDSVMGLPVDCVTHDAYEGALAAMRHLITQGHRRIALLKGPDQHVTVRWRTNAYLYALHEAGIPFDPELVTESDLSVAGGEGATAEFLERQRAFTAIFCANDCSAIGAMRALRAIGLQVPYDVSVLGFDDIETARLVSPALTTVQAHMEVVGAAAVQMLIERIRHPQQPYSTRLLHTSLVVRESVSCVHED